MAKDKTGLAAAALRLLSVDTSDAVPDHTCIFGPDPNGLCAGCAYDAGIFDEDS